MRFPEFILMILIIVLLSTSIFGQENNKNEKIGQQKHSVGIGAGFTTGFGLSYRYLPKKLGIQATFLILPDNYYSSFGATILYKVIQRQSSWFYLYQSNLYSTYRNSGFTCGCPYYEWFNGLGFGTEILLGKHVGLNFMGGTGFYESFDEFTVTGGTGLYFKF
jgi:hypothetical protein